MSERPYPLSVSGEGLGEKSAGAPNPPQWGGEQGHMLVYMS